MREMLNWLASEESGQGMVEYGLILSLVSIAVILMLTGLGAKLGALFTSVTGKINVGDGT